MNPPALLRSEPWLLTPGLLSRRRNEKTMTRLLSLTVLSAAALAGCVGPSAPPDSADSHPANPNAPQSPMPRVRWSLIDTNFMLPAPAPVTNAAGGHEHHEGHEKK